MAVVVGISGYANHGKGICAQALVDKGFVPFSFADPLKSILSLVYDLPFKVFESSDLKAIPHPNLGNKTPREAMQHIGTQGFRSFYSDTWVNSWKAIVRDNLSQGVNIVASDVRFPNEWKAIKSFPNSILVAVERPGLELGEVYEHESEKHVELLKSVADLVLVNDGSVEQLQSKLLASLDLVGV